MSGIERLARSLAILAGVILLGCVELAAQQPVAADSDLEETLSREINSFYREYWDAWERNDFNGIVSRLADDFVLVSFVPGQGPVQVDRNLAVEDVRTFVDAVRGQEALWNHRVLSLLVRSESEVVAVVRSELSWINGGGQDEISLEVLTKDAEGGWRLARKTGERRIR